MEQNQNPAADAAPPPPAAEGRQLVPAFDPVPVRARHDGLTPERQRAFIEHLADTGSATAAARAIGVTEQSLYRLRRRKDAAAFAAAWDAALAHALQRITAFAFDRVLAGTVKRTYYHGELVDEQVVHSERLLLWMLEKGQRLLGDAKPRAAVTADWDEAMARLETGEAETAGAGRVWQTEHGVWTTNFPPPAGFDGFEQGAVGSPGYRRSLTDGEEKANDAAQKRLRARTAAARDAFFGTARRSSARSAARGKGAGR